MATPSFEEMEKTASVDIPKAPSFEDMEQAHTKTEAPKPPPGLSSAPHQQKPLQGNVQWFEDLKQAPMIGPVVAGAQNVVNNADAARREIARHPMEAAGAVPYGAAQGITGALEAPVALAQNAYAAPGQILQQALPPAARQLTEVITGRPAPYYNQMVGGQSGTDRMAEYAKRGFPNTPATVATAATVGGLASPVPGLGAGENIATSLFSNLVKNPQLAKIVSVMAEQALKHPVAAQAARGAAEGAGLGAGYEAGTQAARGETPTVSPSTLLGGGLTGAGLRGAGAGFGKIKTKPVEATPEQQAAQPFVQKKVIGQVIKPKEATFKSVAEATDAAIKGDPAAVEYLNAAFQKNVPSEQSQVQIQSQPELKQGHIQEDVQAEPQPKTETNTALEAIYQKTGKAPSKSISEEENIHEVKQRVPVDELKEKNPETGMYTEPFDISHAEPRRVKWRKSTYGAIPHPEEGFALIGGSIGKRGAEREQTVYESLKKETSVPQLLSAKKLTDIQKESLQGQQKHVAAKETIQPQADAVTKAANKHLDSAIDFIENDNLSDAEKLIKETVPNKVTDVTKKPNDSGILYSQVIPISPIIEAARFTGEKAPKVARAVYGNKWTEAVKNFAKFRRTLDIIDQHTKPQGDDIGRKLWGNLANEMLNTRGANFDADMAPDVQRALRKLSAEEILDPENTPDWTPEQREAIAAQKVIRQDTRDLIKATIERYGDEIHPELKQALEDYSSAQFGGRKTMPNSEIEDILGPITQASYDYLFRWNPKFHLLNLTDPLIAGTSRVGLGNIMHSYSMMRDATIKDYLGSFRIKGEQAYMRDKIHAEQTGLAKALNKPIKIGKFSTEHDIPSEEINERVMMLAGLLEHGERVNGKGKGEQFVRDMAANKIEPEKQIDAMVDALQATNDAVGGGTFGMNKDMVQRSNLLKNFAQFSTQQVRIARLISKYAREKEYGKLNTLLAATIALGGSAVIPKEIEPTLQKLNPKAFYALKYILDSANLPKKAGVDLTDKLKLATINWGTNAGIEDLGKIASKWFGGEKNLNPITSEGRINLLSFVGDLMMIMPITVRGVGGSVAKRALSDMINLGQHEKKVYAYPTVGLPGNYPVGKGTMQYDFWDYLHDQLIPGNESRVQNFIEKKRELSKLKKFGEEPPKDLEKQYPSPGITEGTD